MLEIGLHRRTAGVYSVAFRFTEPGSAADVRLGANQATDIHLNLAQLQFQIVPAEYSQSLTQIFFEAEGVRSAFAQARSAAVRLGRPLRVSLNIDQDCSELHGVYWELLRDPQTGAPLFLGENLYFSRYLSSADWRKVQLRPKAKLHALALIANPLDLSEYPGLVPIEADAEAQRARQGLGDIALTVLGVDDERASLTNLIAHLQTERPDVLYIVCHGAMLRGEPYLWLEDSAGKTAVTSGKELVERVLELAQLPLMIVLASCQSAGHESAAEARSSLGPRLAEAGVPAVVAMQGNISQDTVAAFMPPFFSALQEDGRVDRAMCLGRGSVREQPDFWMPVLFTRLRSGGIFAVPEAAAREVRFGVRTWVAMAVLILVGFASVIGYLAWPKTRNMRIEERCSFCIAVAGFQQIGSNEQDTLGGEIGAELSGLLDQNLNELRQNSGNIIKVWGPNEVHTLEAPSLEKLDQAAEELAHKIGADILVYGAIDVSQDEWRVEPRFVISPDYFFKDLSEIIGQHQLGSPFNLKDNVEAVRRQNIRETNTQRSRLLVSIVIGETYMATKDYEKALDLFKSVEKDPHSWEDPAAYKLVNLLMGNAAGRAYDPVLSPEKLSAAENYYNLALGADKDYARAYLGLGSVAYARALQKIPQSEDLGDLNSFRLLDVDRLVESQQYDKQASRLAQQPDLAHIQEKVAFGLGKIYFAQAVYTAMTTMQDVSFQPAIDEFQKVIDAYQNEKDEVLKELSAEAYANLGEIYSLTGELDLAAQDYRQAILLNHDPQRQKEFQKELTAVEEEIKASK